MNGVELIKWTRDFMSSHNVSEKDMPRFGFRAQQFWDLPPQTIRDIFDLGVKSDDVIEKVIEVK